MSMRMNPRRDAPEAERELLVVTNNRHRVFQSSIIAGVEEIGRQREYRTVVLEAPRPAEAGELLEQLERTSAGILLVADVLPDEAVERLHELGATISLVSHRVPGVEVPSIMHDNRHGLALLAEELFDRNGRTAPLFVCGSGRQRDALEREGAFRRELMLRGLPVDDSRFLRGEFEPEQAAAELAGFLAGGGKLDSVVAADYLMAIACMGELRRRGLAVPVDVTVLGFGDGPEAEAAGLTTVAADVVELGRRGARQLVGQLEGLAIRGLTLLSTTLVARASSGLGRSHGRPKRQPAAGTAGR
jgi:LacI family transcriptional regulator